MCGVLPIAEPLPTGHSPHLSQQESTRQSWPWAYTGGGPEAAVCLGGEPFRDPLPPGALPRVGFPPWQTTDVSGEAGEGQAPPRTPAAIWAAGGGPGRAPETRLGPGQPLAWAGSQSGGWGVWLAELPLTPPAWNTDAAGARTGQGARGWGGQEGGEGRAGQSSQLRNEPGAPTAEEQGWGRGGMPGSRKVGGGLGDHAAKAQRLRSGGPGQLGTEEAPAAIGLWIPRGVPP